jgi:hypothetical protein
MKMSGVRSRRTTLLGLLTVGLVAIATSACPPPLLVPPPPVRVVLEVVVPADHVRDKHGAMHLPGYKQPEGVCDQCHGAELRGTPEARSCYACHRKKWD